jgi:hypothetical protein
LKNKIGGNMKRLLLLILFIVLFVGIPFAKNSQSKFKINITERLRFVGWDNSINLDEDKDDAFAFTRHRTSFSAQWMPVGNLEFKLKLTNEFRYYMNPKDREFEAHELFFDHFYLKWKNAFKLPLTLTLGRQNIMLGEGFIVMDGHPLDGSRSIYFNAIRADYLFKKNHKFTFFYSYVPETDDILPILNDQEQALIEQAETGIGLYYSGKLNTSGTRRVEAYLIRKETDESDLKPVSSKINAIGARLILPLISNLSLTTEAAYQTGTFGDFDRSAMGGYFHLDYRFKETPILKTLTFGGIYLMGDDPSTEKQEGWDPLFSRWPKWSESYIYTLIRENGVANWSNFNSVYISLLLEFHKTLNFNLTYHRLGAMENHISEFTTGNGKNRGDLIIGKLNFRINKFTTGHFLWENFKPGNFYFEGADSSNWLRFELMFSF